MDLLNKKGFSLLELVLGMAVLAIFTAAIGTMIAGTYRSNLSGREILEKTIKLEKAQEEARITAQKDWDALAIGTYYNDGVVVTVSLVDGDADQKQVFTSLGNLSFVSYLTDWR